jgi:hypothetical protein
MPVRKPNLRSGDEQWNLEINPVAVRVILITPITRMPLLGIRVTRLAPTTPISQVIPRVVKGKMRRRAGLLAGVVRNHPIPVGW